MSLFSGFLLAVTANFDIYREQFLTYQAMGKGSSVYQVNKGKDDVSKARGFILVKDVTEIEEGSH
jgi:hypothetical protein